MCSLRLEPLRKWSIRCDNKAVIVDTQHNRQIVLELFLNIEFNLENSINAKKTILLVCVLVEEAVSCSQRPIVPNLAKMILDFLMSIAQ